MSIIKLYEVDNKYIDYLQSFDKNVLNHSSKNYSKSRKYIGVLLNINGFDYIAPLSSPKNSDYVNGVIRPSIVPIIRIKRLGNGELLGTIKLSSMIPIFDKKVIKFYDLSIEKDINYKNLVLDQVTFMYANKKLIFKNAKTLYNQKLKNMSIGYVKNTVDFKLLESKSKLYKN